MRGFLTAFVLMFAVGCLFAVAYNVRNKLDFSYHPSTTIVRHP